jgi:hypothetical protein
MRAHLQAEIEQIVIDLSVLLCLLPRAPPNVNTVILDDDGEGARVCSHCSLRAAGVRWKGRTDDTDGLLSS